MAVKWCSMTFCTEKSVTNLNCYSVGPFICYLCYNLGVFRHVRDTESRENSKVLLKAFQKNVDVKKKYGPEVSIQYIKCLGELAVVCA
jgi:hypothetical protein